MKARVRQSVPDRSTALKRVAIYCRQSVEDAHSAFGSIDAQLEAVRAFVVSQKGDGWVALPTPYIDGGFSGATIQRPDFQRLLTDVKAGRVDVIATYKLDRLSRSIGDFVSLMALFDEHGVTFCSVTQQFSTATSVGRMTMNLLVTFAQFEREQIAERTRDKMAASRRRGMWTGGYPILGYDLINKKLVVNAFEAERVVAIFELYLSLGSLMSTVVELNARGWKTKSWTTHEGKLVHGGRFTKHSLHRVLSNVIYVGLMPYKDERHKGEHAAIVSMELFDAVATQMGTHSRSGGALLKNKHGALLRGIVACGACGSSMLYHCSQKHGRLFAYYICSKAAKQGASACPGSRAPAGQLEAFVVERVRAIGSDPEMVDAAVSAAHLEQRARIPELSSAIREHEAEERKLLAEQEQLTAAIGRGVTALGGRLGEVDRLLQDALSHARDARDELLAIESRVLDESALRKTLADFDPVWNELFPKERARILRLLIGRVLFHAQTSEIEIRFRGGAPAALERSA